MNDKRPQRVFLETLGINIDLDQLTLLEIIARKQRRSVEALVVEAVLRYAAKRRRKSRPLSTEDDQDEQADWWKTP
jgi:hypothetical protein